MRLFYRLLATALIAATLLAISVFVYAQYQDKEVVAFIDEWNEKQKAEKK